MSKVKLSKEDLLNLLFANKEQILTESKIFKSGKGLWFENGHHLITGNENESVSVGDPNTPLSLVGSNYRPVYWQNDKSYELANLNDVNNLSMKPSDIFLFVKITEFTTANAQVFTAPANGYVTIRGEFGSNASYYLRTATGTATFYQRATTTSSPFFAVKKGDSIHVGGEGANIVWADLYFSQADVI